jgi:uncharacterized protein YdhG (YjbR/CyaY superfamily)
MPPKKSKARAASKAATSKAGQAPDAGRTRKAKPVSPAEGVSAYIDRVPNAARVTFDKLRATVRSAAPSHATEIISYTIPALRHEGVTVWYAAFSKHCSLFPGAGLIKAHADELKGYTISKGTIQFPIGKPLPAAVIKKLVRDRFREGSRKM